MGENHGRAGNFPLPVKDYDRKPAAHGYFLKESMAFGEPLLEQFYLKGTVLCRRDTMLKQRKSVRRRNQERENGMD